MLPVFSVRSEFCGYRKAAKCMFLLNRFRQLLGLVSAPPFLSAAPWKRERLKLNKHFSLKDHEIRLNSQSKIAKSKTIEFQKVTPYEEQFCSQPKGCIAENGKCKKLRNSRNTAVSVFCSRSSKIQKTSDLDARLRNVYELSKKYLILDA